MIVLFIVIALILLVVMLAVCLRPGSCFRRHLASLKTDPRSYFSLPELKLIFRSLLFVGSLLTALVVSTPAMAAKGGKAYRLAHQAAPPEEHPIAPIAPSAPVADRLGQLYTSYNGRIVPLRNVALEMCKTLFGTESYKGLTAEQVMFGYYYYGDIWSLETITTLHRGDTIHAQRCQQFIRSASDGSLFCIQPSSDGRIWSPDTVALNRVGMYLNENQTLNAFREVEIIREHQLHFAPEGMLPSNRIAHLQTLLGNQLIMYGYTILLVLGAICSLFYAVRRFRQKRRLRQFTSLPIWLFALLMGALLSLYLAMAWLAGGFLPLSSPSLMCEVAAWMALVMALVSGLLLYHHPLRAVAESAFLTVAAVLIVVAVGISMTTQGADQLPAAASVSYLLMMATMAFASVWVLLELIWLMIRLVMSLADIRPVFDHLLVLNAYPMVYSLLLLLLSMLL